MQDTGRRVQCQPTPLLRSASRHPKPTRLSLSISHWSDGAGLARIINRRLKSTPCHDSAEGAMPSSSPFINITHLPLGHCPSLLPPAPSSLTRLHAPWCLTLCIQHRRPDCPDCDATFALCPHPPAHHDQGCAPGDGRQDNNTHYAAHSPLFGAVTGFLNSFTKENWVQFF